MSKHKHEHGQSSNTMKPEQTMSAESLSSLQNQQAEGQAGVPEVEIQPGAEPDMADMVGQPGAQPGAVTTPEAQLAAAKAEIELLKAQLAELNDKYLRALAEQVNFRKRMTKEKEEYQQYALSTLLSDLIPVLDDFDRSLEAAAQSQNDVSKVIEGIRLVQKRLLDTLANKYGLARYDAEGSVFDPHMHEAMFSDQGDVTEPTVTQEFMPGYKLHDRVIRAAKVKVTVPANNGAEKAPAQMEKAQGQAQDESSTANSSSSGQNDV
ncbi:MAG: nucleotide exchange factor GrpE [Rectinema subterraneum]